MTGASAGGTLGPLQSGKAGPPYTYVGVALSMVNGAKALAALENPPHVALAFLAAHGLECILKAYLSRGGDDAAVKHKEIRHNLNELWSQAVANGLVIPPTPPSWVSTLSELHERPYYLRYSTDVHAMGVPPSQPMTTELNDLFLMVCGRLSEP